MNDLAVTLAVIGFALAVIAIAGVIFLIARDQTPALLGVVESLNDRVNELRERLEATTTTPDQAELVRLRAEVKRLNGLLVAQEFISTPA